MRMKEITAMKRLRRSCRRACTWTAAALVVAAFILAPSAGAHFANPRYSALDNCSRPVDPISLVYYGDAAANFRVTQDLRRHTGWFDVGGDGGQRVPDGHGNCMVMWDALADHHNVPPSGRFHIRIWSGNGEANHKDEQGRYETIGTPHHEDYHRPDVIPPIEGCGVRGGHAVDMGTKENPTREGSGFDQGRRRIRQRVNTRRHDVKLVYLGNTRAFRQCDGEDAGSNGNVLWVSIGNH
jgi:hypothetical protein